MSKRPRFRPSCSSSPCQPPHLWSRGWARAFLIFLTAFAGGVEGLACPLPQAERASEELWGQVVWLAGPTVSGYICTSVPSGQCGCWGRRGPECLSPPLVCWCPRQSISSPLPLVSRAQGGLWPCEPKRSRNNPFP